jgi:hypothetical protein
VSDLSTTQALVALLLLVAGPGGAAWVAVKVSLNGARQDIRDIKSTTGRMERTVERLDERSQDHERRIRDLEDAA